MRTLKACLFFITLLIWITSCSSESMRVVQPWERGELAGDLLRPDLNTLEDYDWDHIYFSKEGMVSGFSSGGGGCGCN